jgi:hypothetical protein
MIRLIYSLVTSGALAGVFQYLVLQFKAVLVVAK